MFSRRVKIFNLMGFNVWVDLSWLFIAILITWSLANVFPQYYPGLSTTARWGMGVAGAIGLFLSIVVHELCHSLVARRYGLAMKGITLFIFGGVAEMDEEPQSAKAEFMMAIAGPASSAVIAVIFLFVYMFAKSRGMPVEVTGVAAYLSWINALLLAFNLVPAFPLDGGRVLRSALWSWKGNLRKATRISSEIGAGFGLVLIFLGVFSFMSGNVVGGVWWVLIGLFLRNAAKMSYKQLTIRRFLEGEPISHFMMRNPITVPANTSVRDLVNNYIYRYHFKVFPVSAYGNGKILGCVSTSQVKGLDKEEWPHRTVAEIASQCSDKNSVPSSTDAMKALGKMNSEGLSLLMVMDDGKLEGVVSLRDLMGFLASKLELEEGR